MEVTITELKTHIIKGKENNANKMILKSDYSKAQSNEYGQ